MHHPAVPAERLDGVLACPVVIVSRCRTFIAARLSLIVSGSSSDAKNETTLSSSDNSPASIARPMAVDVKLFDTENSRCGSVSRYGDHSSSSTTWPWRSSITVWISWSDASSAATKLSSAAADSPWASGVLRRRLLIPSTLSPRTDKIR